MRMLLLILIVNAFAWQTIANSIVDSLLSIIDKSYVTPSIIRKLTDNFFNYKHKMQLSSADKYPARESDVIFWCTITNHESAEIKLNDDELKNKLTTDRPTNFVIHGFMSGLDAEWINRTVRDWVKYHRCNVCAVDWSALAGKGVLGATKYATVATKHTKQVANVIHRFMEFLVKERVMITDAVSIAGHSLGAHIAGLVGASFGGKIHSIYGLDSAGPAFTHENNDVKLDKGDARYVQCIYTDANVFGTAKKYGNCDANFLVNGGVQTGCLRKLFGVFTCQHSRACDYFQESLNSNDEFWGIRCPLNSALNLPLSFLDLTHNNEADKIGVHSAELNGTFCVDTKPESPFAMSRNSFLLRINQLIANHGTPHHSSSFWDFVGSGLSALNKAL